MTARVAWIADGDTIHVRIGERVEKGRSIGVHALEVPHDVRGWQAGGEEVSVVNRTLGSRHDVHRARDVSPRRSGGRLVAYVFVRRAKRRVMANAELCGGDG